MTSTACPICSRHVRPENLTLHVEACLNKHEQLETPILSTPQSRKPTLPAANATPNRRSSPRSQEIPSPSSSSVATKKRKRSTRESASDFPLAERMRPNDLDDIAGQDELLGAGSLLAALIQTDQVPNMIVWGYDALSFATT